MSEIKMLPLPKVLQHQDDRDLADLVQAHARAVAEHNVKLATAELHRQFGCELRDPNGTIWDHAAKLQAEIEALRAEAIEWRGLFGMAKARADKAETRAERLGEALRELVALGHPRDPAIIAARAALRDHDQEVGNG